MVQLYISKPASEVTRPIRELKNFQKISLKPGEEKEVKFVLDKRAFAYYEEKIHAWNAPWSICNIRKYVTGST